MPSGEQMDAPLNSSDPSHHLFAKRFKCLQCDKTFHKKGGVPPHVKSVHLRERHQCPACIKTFSTRGNLGTHFATFHSTTSVDPSNTGRFKCTECDRAFSHRCRLTTHIRAAHLGLRHQCPACPKDFTIKYAHINMGAHTFMLARTHNVHT